ncbi:MAG: phenylacetate-CoA ligase [Thermoleophilaceae bacterium]|jgi:phenylacetate-CoA ligase|nr:phenylacetate-CoA ligase [Thermoleophilaceae bacterium]
MSATSDRAIWDPVETLPRERLRELQLERLRATVAHVLEAQPLGATRLTGAGVSGAPDIASLDDLARLPFSHKRDLRDHYPFGLLAVPRERLVRLHASSGSHGKPTVVGYTRADLDAWAELMARCMTMAGVRPGMLVHNANGYGLFTGGLGFHDGGERLGATVVPVSGGFTARQAMLLGDLGSQVLVATPSYALAIAQALRDAGVDPADLKLELGLFGGEPFSAAMRAQIERELGLSAVAFYGLSEMCGPGVAAECLPVRDGLHVQEDHFIVEVVDPDGDEPLAEGEEGELVFTTLAKEALPLIRYRTGDIGSVVTTPCECGRTSARVVRLRGRRDDMLIVRGVNLFPSNVEHLLLGVEEVAPHYRLIVERAGAMDELTVECEPAVDGVDTARLAERVEQLLREHTGLRIAVAVVERGAVPRSEGKAVRVVDRRSD